MGDVPGGSGHGLGGGKPQVHALGHGQHLRGGQAGQQQQLQQQQQHQLVQQQQQQHHGSNAVQQFSLGPKRVSRVVNFDHDAEPLKSFVDKGWLRAQELLHKSRNDRQQEKNAGATNSNQRRVGLNNALEYFSLSPFYDRKCNNELVIERCGGGSYRSVSMQAMNDRLVALRGVEYRVQTTQSSNLFIIVKQFRCSRTVVRKLAMYFILDDTIYLAPGLQNVVLERLAKCSFHVRNAFQLLGPYRYALLNKDDSLEINRKRPRQEQRTSVNLVRRRRRRVEDQAQMQITSILQAMHDQFVPNAGIKPNKSSDATSSSGSAPPAPNTSSSSSLLSSAVLGNGGAPVANETPAVLTAGSQQPPSITPQT